MAITRIRVGHEAPTAEDVLDFAHALVEEYGFNHQPTTTQESSDDVGYTLHDSVGEACTRLSRSTTGSPTKDWTVRIGEGEMRNLREEAQGFVNEQLSQIDPTLTDIAWSDQAGRTTKDVLDVLEKARDAARGDQIR